VVAEGLLRVGESTATPMVKARVAAAAAAAAAAAGAAGAGAQAIRSARKGGRWHRQQPVRWCLRAYRTTA
jgi:hypothetical protein